MRFGAGEVGALLAKPHRWPGLASVAVAAAVATAVAIAVVVTVATNEKPQTTKEEEDKEGMNVCAVKREMQQTSSYEIFSVLICIS